MISIVLHERPITLLELYTGFHDFRDSRSDFKDFKDFRPDFKDSD